MRSRSAIHNSACSCRGMPSHLFSMLARVGFEMAWPVEAVVEAAARKTREVVAWRLACERLARSTPDVDSRIILFDIRARLGSISSVEERAGGLCWLSR